MEDNLLTLEDVMNQLKISHHTINRYIKLGYLPVVLVSRNKRFIREQDLDKFLKERTGTYKP